MKNYECLKCGAKFDTPSVITRQVERGGLVPVLTMETVNACPGCESTKLKSNAGEFIRKPGMFSTYWDAFLFFGMILSMLTVAGYSIYELYGWRWS